MMVGFVGRPWAAHGSNGSSYSDLAHHQTTWETNPARAGAQHAILTDYSGGDRGDALDPGAVQLEADRFLANLELVFPGAQAAARRSGSDIVAHLEHWPSNPLTLGSYTCYRPGQFTTIAGLEGLGSGNLFFAGEHANSFYDWQGFMEGAALSGLDAARSLLSTAKR
jgi:monoamine oxidase